MAKDFKTTVKEAAEAGRVQTAVEQAATEKKAEKVGRINLLLDPDIYDFIKVTAKATGQTQCGFLQYIVREYMKGHRDVYDKAKDLLNSL